MTTFNARYDYYEFLMISFLVEKQPNDIYRLDETCLQALYKILSYCVYQ